MKIIVWAAALACCFGLGLPRNAAAGVLADLDPMVTQMATRFASIEPTLNSAHSQYFDRPIPKVIHQIWFGDAASRCDDRAAQWRLFASTYGYSYHLWTEADNDTIKTWMPAKNFAILQGLRRCGNYHAASDVLRFSLLHHFGGVYCDVDMAPPRIDGNIVDLQDVFPMRGMILLTENFAMNVGNSAMFFANGLMMASPNHPMYTHLEKQLPHNFAALHPGAIHAEFPLCHIDAVYASGPAFLSRSLSGVFTTLPITYARKLGMVDDGKWDAECGEAYTTDEIQTWKPWRCGDK